MDWIYILIGALLLITGIVGCFLPVLPGPPIAYLSFFALQLSSYSPFTVKTLLIYGILMLAVTALDYLVPIWGTKKQGGTKYGTWGSTIGLIAGIFAFPPFGIIVGPFAGALIGEMIGGKEFNESLKIGFGAFLGFLAGIIMKLVLCMVFVYEFIAALV